MGIKDNVYADPVSQERLLEQLSEAFAKGNVYEVKQDGTGDYFTISEVLEVAESQDTLLIYQGIYEESIEVYDKTINRIGTIVSCSIIPLNIIMCH